MAESSRGKLKRRASLYRAFSGLTNCYRSSMKKAEDEVILVSAVREEAADGGKRNYQTMFFKSAEDGGEWELMFFRKLDDEFNKVLDFYQKKVEEVLKEAEELSKQMDALIALRIKVENPVIGEGKFINQATDDGGGAAYHSNARNPGQPQMDVIPEVEMSSQGNSMDAERQGNEEKGNGNKINHGGVQVDIKGFRLASLHVLDHVKIKFEPETPMSTIKSILTRSNLDLSFSIEELKKVERLMGQAFIEFYRKLGLIKRYWYN